MAKTTILKSFGGAKDAPLMDVRAGACTTAALSRADLILDYTQRRISDAMLNTNGTTVELHYDDVEMLDFLLETARALRAAAGAVA